MFYVEYGAKSCNYVTTCTTVSIYMNYVFKYN